MKQCRNLTQEARQRGAKAACVTLWNKARDAYSDIMPIIRELRGKGLSQQAIADELNRLGHTTRRAKPWNQTQVHRLLRRIGQPKLAIIDGREVRVMEIARQASDYGGPACDRRIRGTAAYVQ